ncbi:hypothetical protein MRU69_13000 [Kocuria flava]|uniref:hypothetical protein n=1 Tax=Kocuria flava TaxID=446860 RepID=UPI001FF60F5C|nr:hypothetical protein [Kocuria flava]MCJ8505763.1 hypothetical protein [Kocuria flava]
MTQGEDAGAPAADGTAPPPTGHPEVDAALARVAELPATPLEEHAELYETVHARLSAALEAEPGAVPAALRPDAPAQDAGP